MVLIGCDASHMIFKACVLREQMVYNLMVDKVLCTVVLF